MRMTPLSWVACAALLFAGFASTAFAQGYTYRGGSSASSGSSGYTSRSASNAPRPGGYGFTNRGGRPAASETGFTHRDDGMSSRPETARDAHVPYWEAFNLLRVFAGYSDSGRASGSDIGYLGASGYLNLISDGENYPEQAFRLTGSLKLSFGSKGGADTASLLALPGLEFFKLGQLGENGTPKDFYFSIAGGLGYNYLFGGDDDTADSQLIGWASAQLNFPKWDGLGGLAPNLQFALQVGPRDKYLRTDLKLHVLVWRGEEGHKFYLGGQWTYKEQKDGSAYFLNQVGPSVRFFVPLEAGHELSFSLRLLYEDDRTSNGWAVMLGGELRIF